jgi:hypothetical protein
VCKESLGSCTTNGDCCGFSTHANYCVNTGGSLGAICAIACTSDSECNSGCCAPLKSGGSVCAPATQCQVACAGDLGSCTKNGDCCGFSSGHNYCVNTGGSLGAICAISCTSNSQQQRLLRVPDERRRSMRARERVRLKGRAMTPLRQILVILPLLVVPLAFSVTSGGEREGAGTRHFRLPQRWGPKVAPLEKEAPPAPRPSRIVRDEKAGAAALPVEIPPWNAVSRCEPSGPGERRGGHGRGLCAHEGSRRDRANDVVATAPSPR